MKKKIFAIVMAIVMCVGMLCACGNKSDNGITTVSWYLSGVKKDSSYDKVFNAVNEILKEKYSMQLEIIMTDGNNFSQKIQMMNAGREAYDLVFTSNWLNDYYTNVQNGALYDLTELLPEYAPKLYESITDVEKSAITVNGGIYAVPNWQVQARATSLCIPKDKLEKTGMTLDDIKTVEDVTTYLRKIVALEPDSDKVKGYWTALMPYYGMVTVVKEGAPGCIYYDKSGKPQVINQFASPEFKEYVKIRKQWIDEGLVKKIFEDKNYGLKDIQQAPFWFSNYKPGIEADSTRAQGYDMKIKQFSPAVVSNEVLISTLTGVGANSEHPEAAVKMLEIMHTDKEVYNMLSWGVEGEEYTKISDNKIKLSEDATYSMSNWALGSVMNSYITENQSDTIWEETKKYNDGAIATQLLGFVLNTDPINSDLGNCETVIKERFDALDRGTVDDVDAAIEELNEALKVAGVDAVIAEIQRQIDEWWESK